MVRGSFRSVPFLYSVGDPQTKQINRKRKRNYLPRKPSQQLFRFHMVASEKRLVSVLCFCFTVYFVQSVHSVSGCCSFYAKTFFQTSIFYLLNQFIHNPPQKSLEELQHEHQLFLAFPSHSLLLFLAFPSHSLL